MMKTSVPLLLGGRARIEMAQQRRCAKSFLKENPMKQTLSANRLLPALFLVAGLTTVLTASAAQLPPVHEEGAITYVSGGIGEDEASAMKQAAAQYPLEMTFVTRERDGHDAYLAADEVIIRDQRGRVVLDTRSDGPYLLASLPAGRYRIEAIDHGQPREHTVTVKPAQHTHAVFEW